MPTLSPVLSKTRLSNETESKIPLDSKRLSELAGFLLCVLGLLVTLSLVSYLPFDPSLNTAPDHSQPGNWIGLWGSYSADALFQAFGWVAYLIPVVCFVVGIRALLVRSFPAPWSKGFGTAQTPSSRPSDG